ncbi:MAG: ribosome biogenesis GTPase Der [Deltaproteobacteria bacterium]|nr:ribosome biogenesis GTPase Der [Deltaproteobacteria bacterium]
MSRPVVAIVGRPNVGKSTLFNRIVGKHLAIVEDVPGVTRDRHYADAEWDGFNFTVVDTGGFLPETDDKLLQQVRDQARLAIDEASAVILVVDAMAGLSGADQEVGSLLRKSGKPVFVAANKIDGARREEESGYAEIYRLGLKYVMPTSAEHGRGVADLLDEVVKTLQKLPAEEKVDETACRVAIIGRPNVGKSTLVNAIVGEERVVANPLAGTTRDSVDTPFEFGGMKYVLTDTAGIRRKKSIAQKVEHFSVLRAFKSLDGCDVAVLMMDATQPAVDQDAKIAGLALEKGKALILCINKWDLVEKDPGAAERYRAAIKRELAFVSFAPVIFTSAATGAKVEKVLEVAHELWNQFQDKVPTPKLNQFLKHATDAHPAPLDHGKPIKLYYIAQVGTRPPSFSITVNRPKSVPEHYQRYLINQLRDAFGFKVPLKLLFKERPGHGQPRHRAR